MSQTAKHNNSYLDSGNLYQSFSGAFSMGVSSRPNFWNKNDVPPPGAYNLDANGKFSKIQGPKWSKFKKQQLFDINKDTPSPHSYQIQSKIGKGGITICATPFKDLNEKFQVSPLEYDNNTIKVKSKAPEFSLQSKGEDQTSKHTYMQTPGPQKYQIINLSQKQSHNKKQYGFGSGDKNSIYKNNNVSNPGPGSYNYSNANKISINSKFSKERRKGLENMHSRSIPGSGSYDIDRSLINKSFFQGKSIYGADKHSQSQIIKSTPGPGQYPLDKILQKKSPSFKIGTSKRQDLIKNNNLPGPGQYTMQSNPKATYADLDYFQGFGSNPRNTSLLNENNVPGPGTYSIAENSGLGKDGKGCIISNDNATIFQERPQLPGPGSYEVSCAQFNIPKREQNMNYTRNLRTEFQEKNIPGPGRYNLSTQSSLGKGFSFGGMKRMADGDEYSVFQTSPQSYNIKSNMGFLPSYLREKNKTEF